MKKKKGSISYEEISNQEMVDLLVDLAQTNYWPAIVRYNRIKDNEANSGLSTLDPFKAPTQVARTQGLKMGLVLMEGEVVAELKRREEENSKKKGEPTADDSGPLY